MARLTRQEFWTCWGLLALVLIGLAGKALLAARAPSSGAPATPISR